jgi:hypothetical protein
MAHEWQLCDPRYDVDDVVYLGQRLLALEGSPLKTDPYVFRHSLTVASTNQLFDKNREFIAVAREMPLYIEGADSLGKLLGYCWFDRSGYTTYSRDEISNAKFHHVDLQLSPRLRVRLISEMIEQHILWCSRCGIPVICSTSIRSEHDGFMKIHQKYGFIVNGSYAWTRTEDAMKVLNGK